MTQDEREIDLQLAEALDEIKQLRGGVSNTDSNLLAQCLSLLEYATYHDGRYGQLGDYKFQGPAQRLVPILADRLNRKPYEGYGE